MNGALRMEPPSKLRTGTRMDRSTGTFECNTREQPCHLCLQFCISASMDAGRPSRLCRQFPCNLPDKV